MCIYKNELGFISFKIGDCNMFQNEKDYKHGILKTFKTQHIKVASYLKPAKKAAFSTSHHIIINRIDSTIRSFQGIIYIPTKDSKILCKSITILHDQITLDSFH